MSKQRLDPKTSSALATGGDPTSPMALCDSRTRAPGKRRRPADEQADEPGRLAEPSKRPRPALTFSIESIMQADHHHHQPSKGPAAASGAASACSAGDQFKGALVSRSPSPASSQSSGSSGSELSLARSSCPSLGGAASRLHCNQAEPRAKLEPASRPLSPASSTLSRGSTPISPGGGCGADDNDDADADASRASRRPSSASSSSSQHQHQHQHLHHHNLSQRQPQQHQQQITRSAHHHHHNNNNNNNHHNHHHQHRGSTGGSNSAGLHRHHRAAPGRQNGGAPGDSGASYAAGAEPGTSSLGQGGGQQGLAAAAHLGQSSSARLSQVECVLDNKDMWDKFHSLNTEMIITKTGRRMFPVLKVQFHNLDPNARYAVSMDIVPVDSKRYRYAYHKSCWQVAGKADPMSETRLYPHPDSPFNGDLLSRQVISFEKVKLTNNEMDKSGHIILNSMHKYQPRVHLIELKAAPASHTQLLGQQQQQQQHSANKLAGPGQRYQAGAAPCAGQKQQAPQLDIEGYRTYVFPETVFTAVTAYQNQLITKMKIDKNPFAKGFRDSSRLSDLDRNDPFDYMSSMGPAAACAAAVAAAAASGRGFSLGGPGQPGGGPPTPHSGGNMSSPLDHNHNQQQQHQHQHMDQAYAQALLASAAAANNPWYAAAAAAANQANPFAGPGPMTTSSSSTSTPTGIAGAPSLGPCSTSGTAAAAAAAAQAQAQQQLQAQMWLAAAFSACLNGAQPGAAPSLAPAPPQPLPPVSMMQSMGPLGMLTAAGGAGGLVMSPSGSLQQATDGRSPPL